mmetsp:Transcript_4799/g.6941  ORF Transcript_4799/g.6941 Transcript_4799/m.6941 type:complete len:369 (-) Transcript_4799:145-1251(-)
MRLLFFLCCLYHFSVNDAFIQPLNAHANCRYSRCCVSNEARQEDDDNETPAPDRRKAVLTGLTTMIAVAQPAMAVERAVGAFEKKCREEGNCLEVGDLDGAVGWNWGAKERCDATDPQCGVNGLLKSADELAGEAVPQVGTTKITHRVQLTIAIGRKEEGILTLGMYGEDSPRSVSQLLQFLSGEGLWTLKNEDLSQAVALGYGLGSVTEIIPQQQISLGLPSQAAAYAKTHGMSSAGSDFVAQPRPTPTVENEASVRPHNQTGLVSIATKGVGYANTFCDNDEAFANSFSITAAAAPTLDKSRKVIGQVMDQDSMAFLARLSQLPTNKGLKGIVPGQNSGPPLLKTSVKKVTLEKLAAVDSESSSAQ